MKRTKNSVKIDYFQIEGTPGGNQDWCTDFWMYLGGCAALAACDTSLCLAQNNNLKECCPFDTDNITRKAYVDFSMIMKPYIHPRVGGVAKISIFTEGFGKYLKDRGYDVTFDTCPGEESYEAACNFVKKSLEKNLPIAFLLLRHRDKSLKDLNWHWFMIIGYSIQNHNFIVKYHTYGQEQEVDFRLLWNTGMYRRGGMASIREIKRDCTL